MFATNFLARVKESEEWLNMLSMWASKGRDDLVHVHGVKRMNIFFLSIVLASRNRLDSGFYVLECMAFVICVWHGELKHHYQFV
jgi:hypothetical protein